MEVFPQTRELAKLFMLNGFREHPGDNDAIPPWMVAMSSLQDRAEVAVVKVQEQPLILTVCKIFRLNIAIFWQIKPKSSLFFIIIRLALEGGCLILRQRALVKHPMNSIRGL